MTIWTFLEGIGGLIAAMLGLAAIDVALEKRRKRKRGRL